jgi:hypothetical protein
MWVDIIRVQFTVEFKEELENLLRNQPTAGSALKPPS